jgi:hypothetical protein
MDIASVAGSVAGKVEGFFAAVPAYVGAVSSKVLPKLIELMHKTRVIWADLLPYIKAGLIFCISPIGISIAVIGLSTLLLRNARGSSSIAWRVSWLVLGIFTACAGVYLLSTTGIIPALSFIPIF